MWEDSGDGFSQTEFACGKLQKGTGASEKRCKCSVRINAAVFPLIIDDSIVTLVII
jgi:hypothetical protein